MFLNILLLLAVVVMLQLIAEHYWLDEVKAKCGFSAKTVKQMEKINNYYSMGGRVQLDEKNMMKLRRYNIKKDKRNG